MSLKQSIYFLHYGCKCNVLRYFRKKYLKNWSMKWAMITRLLNRFDRDQQKDKRWDYTKNIIIKNVTHNAVALGHCKKNEGRLNMTNWFRTVTSFCKEYFTIRSDRSYEWIDLVASGEDELQTIARKYQLNDASVIDSLQAPRDFHVMGIEEVFYQVLSLYRLSVCGRRRLGLLFLFCLSGLRSCCFFTRSYF